MFQCAILGHYIRYIMEETSQGLEQILVELSKCVRILKEPPY